MFDKMGIVQERLYNQLKGYAESNNQDLASLLAMLYFEDPDNVFKESETKVSSINNLRYRAIYEAICDLKSESNFNWKNVIKDILIKHLSVLYTASNQASIPMKDNSSQQNIIKHIKSPRPPTQGLNSFYLLLLLLFITFTTLLISRGLAEKPDVTIDFNVGEIIAGLLAGAGVAAAGGAYAFKTIKEVTKKLKE